MYERNAGSLWLVLFVILFCLGQVWNHVAFSKNATQKEIRSEFTPTLVEAYKNLEKGEAISGREYLALEQMVNEHARMQKINPSSRGENTQLEELCVLMQIYPQELIALMMDTEEVTVQRTSPWTGNSQHHL